MSANDSTPQTRPSLLVRIRDANDDGSWREFVDTYTPLVYRYCRRKGLQDADAADVAQEVLTEVARCIRRFEYQPERGRFRDWLGTIARRRLARFLESKGRAPSTEANGCAEGVGQTEAEWTDEFNSHLMAVALERVRPRCEPATWAAFSRVWLEDRSAAEAAAELRLPIEAVYLAKSRVLKRLREELLALAEDLPHVIPLD
jgi:RNA polymerase sigma-70 factor (ECF subfamily)